VCVCVCVFVFVDGIRKGYSLAGAACLNLAKLLHQDGYLIERVLTFGQPRMEQIEESSRSQLELHETTPRIAKPPFPVLRFLHYRDPVYKMCKGFRSSGQAVILLAGPFYTVADDGVELEDAEDVAQGSIGWPSMQPDRHLLDFYVQSIERRARRCSAVHFRDRAIYADESRPYSAVL
jgi:hypothetical protein